MKNLSRQSCVFLNGENYGSLSNLDDGWTDGPQSVRLRRPPLPEVVQIRRSAGHKRTSEKK
jgi:hypothetical protein